MSRGDAPPIPHDRIRNEEPMFDQNTPRKQAIGDALQALQAMRLGVAERTIAEDGRITFTITMNRDECATQHRLGRMVDLVQSMGFRRLLATVKGPVLTIECVRSRRVYARVERIACLRGEWTIITGSGIRKPEIVRIGEEADADHAILAFTQKDDSIVLWYDHDEKDQASSEVSQFVNVNVEKTLSSISKSRG